MNRFVIVLFLLSAATSVSNAQSAESADLHFDCSAGKPTIHLVYLDSDALAGLKDTAATKANYALYRIVDANKPAMHTVPLALTVSVPPGTPDSDQVDLVLGGPCNAAMPTLPAGGYLLEIKASALRYKGPQPQPKAFEDVDVTF